MNDFDTYLTNAICEGLNAMIHVANHKARVFQSFDSYAVMIYLVVGKRNLAIPVPF